METRWPGARGSGGRPGSKLASAAIRRSARRFSAHSSSISASLRIAVLVIRDRWGGRPKPRTSCTPTARGPANYRPTCAVVSQISSHMRPACPKLYPFSLDQVQLRKSKKASVPDCVGAAATRGSELRCMPPPLVSRAPNGRSGGHPSRKEYFLDWDYLVVALYQQISCGLATDRCGLGHVLIDVEPHERLVSLRGPSSHSRAASMSRFVSRETGPYSRDARGDIELASARIKSSTRSPHGALSWHLAYSRDRVAAPRGTHEFPGLAIRIGYTGEDSRVMAGRRVAREAPRISQLNAALCEIRARRALSWSLASQKARVGPHALPCLAPPAPSRSVAADRSGCLHGRRGPARNARPILAVAARASSRT